MFLLEIRQSIYHTDQHGAKGRTVARRPRHLARKGRQGAVSAQGPRRVEDRPKGTAENLGEAAGVRVTSTLRHCGEEVWTSLHGAGSQRLPMDDTIQPQWVFSNHQSVDGGVWIPTNRLMRG